MVFNSNITEITTSTTLDTGFDVYLVDASGGSITVTLPAIVADGMQYKLHRSDDTANTVTIVPTGGDTIEGTSSAVLQQNTPFEIHSSGNDWGIVISNIWEQAPDTTGKSIRLNLGQTEIDRDLIFPEQSTEANGAMVLFDTSKGAFRAGQGGLTAWLNANRGNHSVAFGNLNRASGNSSTIGGGVSNIANGIYSTIGGGKNNTSTGNTSTVGGGRFNRAKGNGSTVVGGINNLCFSFAGILCGGQDNEIIASASNGFLGGGNSNDVRSFSGGVLAGTLNLVDTFASRSVIVGGEQNDISANNSGIVSGFSNEITNVRSFIGAGYKNEITQFDSVIGGGYTNTVLGVQSIIGCGRGNTVDAGSCSILGGSQNTITADFSSIGGGLRNKIFNNAQYSFIGGGNSNTINAASTSTIGGGLENIISGINAQYSNIAGGFGNTCNGLGSTVIGGVSNKARKAYSIVGGRNATSQSSNTFVWADRNGLLKTVNTDCFIVAGGGNASGTTLAAIFYSNAARTTGVQLVAKGNAWASISDRNKKENIVELNYNQILEKLDRIPMYQYNFIGTDKSMVCMGPMAQDWRAEFPSKEHGLLLNTAELDGVALTSIKALSERVKELSKKVETQDKLLKDLLLHYKKSVN